MAEPDPQPEPGPAAPAPRVSRLARLRRLVGYAGWTFAAAALPLALDRLLIHPVLSRELGDQRFSALVWALALINIVGLVGYNGFGILLLRDFAGKPEAEGRRLFRTAVLLTGVMSVLVIAVGVAVGFWKMPEAFRGDMPPLLLGLAGFGVVRAVGMITVTHLRIRRRFQWVFVLRAAEAGVLLVNLAFASQASMWLIVAVYVLSVLVPLPIGAFAARDVVGVGAWWSGPQARWLVSGWFAGAAISLIDQGQVYVARLLLGVIGEDPSDVGALYAAAAIGVMFIIPVQMMSQLVLSLLGGKATFALGGKRGWQYLGVTLVFSVFFGSLSYLVGRWLVAELYPGFADTAPGLYHFIAIYGGCEAIKQMIRPVLLKYAALHRTVFWSGLVLTVQVVALFVLIPRYQADGAAMAMAISGAVSAAVWVGYYLRVHKRLSPRD